MENNPIREIPVPLLLNQILHAQTYWVMQCMKEVDLKPGQAGCLFILSKEGRLPQKEISKKAWSETSVHHGASEKAGGKRTDRTKF